MKQTNQKINFWKDILKSIKDLDKYEDFALELPKDAMKYFLKLLLLFCSIICVFYSINIVNNLKAIYCNLKQTLPDFSYADGKLEMQTDHVIILEDYKDTLGKIILDTSEDEQMKNQYAQEKRGILVLKDKVVLLSPDSMGQVSYSYKELAKNYGIDTFTKQEVEQFIEKYNKIALYGSIYFILFIYLGIAYFFSITMDVLLLSALAWIISRISRLRLKYAPAFGIAVHAVTLPILLNLIYIVVNLMTGFRVQYFQLMYNAIAYIYVIVGILMIKTDFINRQMELIKLAQEQEKIREELKRNEEEEKQKKKEENQNPDKNEEEKKEDSKQKKKQQEEKGIGADAPACKEAGE